MRSEVEPRQVEEDQVEEQKRWVQGSKMRRLQVQVFGSVIEMQVCWWMNSRVGSAKKLTAEED